MAAVQGLLLRWQLGPCRETQGGQHTVKEHSLAGNLLAAAFSSDSRHLFLVASGGWLLLTSPDAWSSIVMAAGHSEAPPQAALLGGMLLEGVHESDGSGNQAALVWDAAGAGRLLGFRTGQSWELILSLSLPQDCGPRCVAAFDGGHAIVAVPSQGSHIEPSLVQLHGEQQAELLGPREAVFPRVSNGNGTLHSPQKEQADVSTDRALVCMVARKSSHAADICFKVSHSRKFLTLDGPCPLAKLPNFNGHVHQSKFPLEGVHCHACQPASRAIREHDHVYDT